MAPTTGSGFLFDEQRHETSVLEGVVQRVVYADPDGTWAVVRLLRSPDGGELTAVGPLFGVQAGERLQLSGRWEHDRKFGRQFRVTSYLSLMPTTLQGIEKYLGSGLISGIGPVMAKRLVERFGLRTLDTIENRPEQVTEVPGIGPRRAEQIREAWQRHQGIREILIFLQSQGISTGQAIKIYQHYGERAIAVIRSNPYRLAEELFGFGFQTADQIASRLGIEHDSPLRAAAGVLHILELATGQGHMFLPEERLVAEASELLSITPAAVEAALELSINRGDLVRDPSGRKEEGRTVYQRRLFAAEVEVAARLLQLLATPGPELPIDWRDELARFERRQKLELSRHQKQAVARTLTDRVLIITGGPGTGKTTLIRAVVELHSRADRRVLLAAPTGRAAKRLAETTGIEAKTLHRLLEFEPHSMSFQRGRDRPLEAEVVIVDETSMLDCLLADHLLQAVDDSCQLILVGDMDQLPSVGPGRLLADLILSGRIPVVRLREVFRQAARSLIVANAHRIRRGLMPSMTTDRVVDFYYIERRQPEEILETIRHLVTVRIPRRFGFDPRRDIQLLSPMRKGLVGVENLNVELQQLLNPDRTPLAATRGRLRRGDRVMQIRNNYELEVFNGDIGHALGPHRDGEYLEVDFYGRPISYPMSELDQLVLAYACSVHKAQGSEYPCVVIPLHSQHYVMLQRNLLYTAVTRGQQLVIVVGETRALARAVRNDRPQVRFTRLADRLR